MLHEKLRLGLEDEKKKGNNIDYQIIITTKKEYTA